MNPSNNHLSISAMVCFVAALLIAIIVIVSLPASAQDTAPAWEYAALAYDGDTAFALPNESKINSFRTYLSGYGREHLSSYENGWRFECRVVIKTGDEWDRLIYVWKVTSSMIEKASRSHPHKSKK